MRTRVPDSEKQRARCDYWADLISPQEQSGLTVHAFCEQRGVTEESFYGWRKQLQGTAPVGFALVEAKGSGLKLGSAVELVLPTGAREQISAGTDAAKLRRVLGVLQERMCSFAGAGSTHDPRTGASRRRAFVSTRDNVLAASSGGRVASLFQRKRYPNYRTVSSMQKNGSSLLIKVDAVSNWGFLRCRSDDRFRNLCVWPLDVRALVV